MTHTDFDIASTEYFRIHCRLSQYGEPARVIAQIEVNRRDTDEPVKGGFIATGEDETIVRSEAKQRVASELIPRLEGIGAPEDWGTQVRQIHARISRVNGLITNSIRTPAPEGGESGICFSSSEEYVDFWSTLIRESVSISAQIGQLSSEERIALLVSPDWVFDDPSDQWSLADLDGRHRAFSFFNEPSAAECKAHEAQLSRLAARFAELGWD